MPRGSGDLDELLASVQPDEERDLLIIELAVADPQMGSRLCPRVKTPLGERQCQQVLGRPHLGAPKREPRRSAP
jgi:hypothetical protein